MVQYPKHRREEWPARKGVRDTVQLTLPALRSMDTTACCMRASASDTERPSSWTLMRLQFSARNRNVRQRSPARGSALFAVPLAHVGLPGCLGATRCMPCCHSVCISWECLFTPAYAEQASSAPPVHGLAAVYRCQVSSSCNGRCTIGIGYTSSCRSLSIHTREAAAFASPVAAPGRWAAIAYHEDDGEVVGSPGVCHAADLGRCG